jgi:flagellar biosynthetic protein FliQ
MNQDLVISIAMEAMNVGLKVALPILLVGLGIGLLVSIFQAVTQIQEQSLSFIPKIFGLVAVIIVAGPWMLNTLLAWTSELYGSIPTLVGG